MAMTNGDAMADATPTPADATAEGICILSAAAVVLFKHPPLPLQPNLRSQRPACHHSMSRPIYFLCMAIALQFVPDNEVFVSALSSSSQLPSSTKPLETSSTTTTTTTTTDASGKTTRIAIVGAGAVGSYYGGRIWESVRSRNDVNVMFHLRNEHYDHCSQHGIDVSSYHGDFTIPAEELLAFPTTEKMAQSVIDSCGDDKRKDDNGTFDWIICALKSTSVS